MVKNKQKFALWITPEAKELVAANFRNDNCQSQSEYIEKAIRFYSGYLNCEQVASYLPRIVADVVAGTLNAFGDRMGKLMFRQAVEQNVVNNILAALSDVDEATYQHLRGKSVRQVMETKGSVSLKDAIKYQREAW